MLNQPLTLPCGAVVPNRMCKAAMTEGLAHPDGTASAELERLYGIWSDGGSGILLSGNIQVDGDHLGASKRLRFTWTPNHLPLLMPLR